MTDYISREMTIDAICRLCNANFEEDPCEPSECEMMSLLRKIPAADVRPVVRGKWNAVKGALHPAETSAVCSNCGFATMIHAQTFYNFCSDCGADMREES